MFSGTIPRPEGDAAVSVEGTETGNRDMLGRAGAMPLAEAEAILRRALAPVPVVAEVELEAAQALHRVTAQALISPEHLPPWSRSTVDGYAVAAADTFGATESFPVYLTVAGEVPMGAMPEAATPPRSCVRIATGGCLPQGADAVIMLEHTVAVDATLIEVTQAVPAGGNVIAKGDDVAAGSVVLPAGHRLRPQDLGLLAGLGFTALPVRDLVRVGIFSTGDEVVEPRQSPPPGKVRDMNGPMLAALVAGCHAEPRLYGIVPDREEAFRALLRKAIGENHLVVFSGGSSVGSRDLGERLLAECGPPGILVHGVAVKPGKPVLIALAGETPVFGLPGHPVSAAVCFDLFVRPTIGHLAGLAASALPDRPMVRARLSRNLHSAAGRTEFVRVSLESDPEGGWQARPVLGKSGALSTLVRAQGYCVIEEAREGLRAGETVTVFLP